MTFRDLWRPARVLFEGEGAGGGAGAGGAGAGGAGDGGAGAGGGAAGAGAGDGGAGGGQKWWEGADYTAEERQWIEARGLADEDVGKIVPKLVKGHRNAEVRLGRPAEQILDRPKEGQSVIDWQRENAALFGLPKTLDEVKIERPKDLAEGIAWDGAFETKARQAAYDLGLTGAQLTGMTALYAGQVQAVLQAADTEAQAASERMMADLGRDWGAELPAKLARARQAANVVATDAGLDAAGIEAMAQALAAKTGDAAVIRMFDRIADMLAEDRMVGGVGGRIGMTPADARAKAASLRAPGGAFFEASAKGDQRKLAELMPELQRLDRLAAGSAP